MISKIDKNAVRKARHNRTRRHIVGTGERPRLNVYRSLNNIYAQVIDDTTSQTLASASTLDAEIKGQLAEKTKKEAAKLVGELVGKRALEKGVQEVVFDRGGYLYTGRVAELAEGARAAGLNGHVGVGMGKAAEIPEAVRKGVEDAKRHMIEIPLVGTSIPHAVEGKFGKGHVRMLPAQEGTGVIAGGPARAVLEMVGIKDIRTKSFGSNNPANCVKATMDGLRQLRTAEEIAKLRGKTVEEILG